MIRVFSKILVSTLLCLTLGCGGEKVVSADSLKFCEEEFTKVQKSGAESKVQMNHWLSLQERCAGTGLYEYRLSKFYIAERDYDNASLNIERGLAVESPYRKELLLAKGDIHLHALDFASAQREYESVLEQFPDWFMGHNQLGVALFAQGDNKNAISHLTTANKSHEQPRTYRTLSMAYYLEGNHEKAVDSLNRAYELDESILADRDPMVAGIRSYAELGKFELSAQLLAMLLEKNPSLETDEEYLKAGFFVREKMIEAGLISE